MIVVWRLTTRCNLACPFCAYDRTLPFARTDTAPALVRAFCQTLADYQNRHNDPVLLSWLGGEPFLSPELPALTAHATSLGLRVSATTNGTPLGSPDLGRHLLDHYAELTVSLDSPDTVHDALRGWPGGFASLRTNLRTLAHARSAQHRPLRLRINTVLLRATLPSFPALAREIATWGVDELTFNLLGSRDRPAYFSTHRPLPSQLAAFAAALPALRRELGPRGLHIAGSPAYLARLHGAAVDTPHPVADCAPGGSFLFIDETGLVSPCSFSSARLGVPVTALRTAADLAALPTRFADARLARRPVACADCPSTHVFQKFAPAA